MGILFSDTPNSLNASSPLASHTRILLRMLQWTTLQINKIDLDTSTHG